MIPLLQPQRTYARRRELLAKSLEPGRDLVIFLNAPERVRNNDALHPYRPNSDFLYMCGYAEPESAFLMWREKPAKGKGPARTRFELFTMPRDPVREQWDGFRYGPEGARKLTGADAAHDIEFLEKGVLEWLAKVPGFGVRPRIFTNAFADESQRRQILDLMFSYKPVFRNGRLPVESIHDVLPAVRDQRVAKDAGELKALRDSGAINVAAHLKLMHELRSGMKEYQVRSILEGEYLRRGAIDLAYTTIAAAGGNATILHYRADSAVCRKGELLLVDAGCEYNFYASDITRTLPIGGKYSKEQRIIMDLVLEAHQEALAKVRPGNLYKEIHKAADDCLREGLKKLKLLPKNIQHTRYYPHKTGHWIGLDVHDPCTYFDDAGESLELKPGMVMTVEPGLYFMPNDTTAPKNYRGIGVRIEDDVVVSAKGPAEVITADLPRSATDIEKEMKRST